MWEIEEEMQCDVGCNEMGAAHLYGWLSCCCSLLVVMIGCNSCCFLLFLLPLLLLLLGGTAWAMLFAF